MLCYVPPPQSTANNTVTNAMQCSPFLVFRQFPPPPLNLLPVIKAVIITHTLPLLYHVLLDWSEHQPTGPETRSHAPCQTG